MRDTSGEGRDETVDLVQGAQHILQYSVVQALVGEGSVCLV